MSYASPLWFQRLERYRGLLPDDRLNLPLQTFDSLPPGQYGWHPRLSERLGGYRLVSLAGSHEVLFTRPHALADAIHLAGRD